MSIYVFNGPHPLASDDEDQTISQKTFNSTDGALQAQQICQIKPRSMGMVEVSLPPLHRKLLSLRYDLLSL